MSRRTSFQPCPRCLSSMTCFFQWHSKPAAQTRMGPFPVCRNGSQKSFACDAWLRMAPQHSEQLENSVNWCLRLVRTKRKHRFVCAAKLAACRRPQPDHPISQMPPAIMLMRAPFTKVLSLLSAATRREVARMPKIWEGGVAWALVRGPPALCRVTCFLDEPT